MQRVIKSMEAKYLQPSLDLVEDVFARWDSAEEGKTVRKLVEEMAEGCCQDGQPTAYNH